MGRTNRETMKVCVYIYIYIHIHMELTTDRPVREI